MNPHEVLSIIELATYLLLLPIVTFLAIYFLYLSRRSRSTAWLYLHAFAVGSSNFYLNTSTY
jgi:hypothetical protein